MKGDNEGSGEGSGKGTRSLLPTLIALTGLICGFTIQNISIVYWTSSAISAYGILVYANIFFVVFFGSLLAAYACHRGDRRVLLVADDPQERTLFTCSPRRLTLVQIACLVGLLNIANGLGVVYASPSSRTPPLIQAILQNSGILFAVPFSKYVLGDRKKYFAPAPLTAAALIVLSISVSVLPTILAGASGEFTGGGVMFVWCAIYLLGIVPGAGYNVVQQLFLIRSGALSPKATPQQITLSSLRALFWCNLFQLMWLIILWPADVLPFFGASTSVSEFWTNTVFSLRCSFGLVSGEGCAPFYGAIPAVWAATFAGGYSMSYIASVQLNRESANFNMMGALATVGLTSLVWLIPNVNPNNSTTPLWSVLASLVTSLAGMLVWKRWEARTPAEEQFAVNDGVDAAGGWEEGSGEKEADTVPLLEAEMGEG